MNKLKLLILTFLLFLPTLTGAHILDLNTGDHTTLESMIDDLEKTRVIFVGELHDRTDHHAAQLDIIHALRQRGLKVVVGLEMFQADYQYALDSWTAKEIDEAEFLPIYQANWSMWSKYDDIFYYARREGMNLLGLNVDRNITRQIMRRGFSSLDTGQLEKLPMLRCDVDPVYQKYMREALGGHLHSQAGFDHFCEAQLVWDRTMAHNLKKYMDQNPDATIVVLAGTGHAWKYGIPEQLGRIADVRMRVVLPQLPGNADEVMATGAEADYLLQGLEYGMIH